MGIQFRYCADLILWHSFFEKEDIALLHDAANQPRGIRIEAINEVTLSLKRKYPHRFRREALIPPEPRTKE